MLEKSSPHFSERIDTVGETICTPEKWIVGLEKSSVEVEEAANGLGF